MSKSIYNEALNIIENIDRNIPSTWLMGRDNLIKIKQTLEQAQKQEKLLRLYKELSIAERKRATFLKTKTVDIYNQLTKVIEWLEKQIKELENEV